MSRSYESWKRLGSEAEAADRARGMFYAADDQNLRADLILFFWDDLDNVEICRDPVEGGLAIKALVDGYRNGG